MLEALLVMVEFDALEDAADEDATKNLLAGLLVIVGLTEAVEFEALAEAGTEEGANVVARVKNLLAVLLVTVGFT